MLSSVEVSFFWKCVKLYTLNKTLHNITHTLLHYTTSLHLTTPYKTLHMYNTTATQLYRTSHNGMQFYTTVHNFTHFQKKETSTLDNTSQHFTTLYNAVHNFATLFTQLFSRLYTHIHNYTFWLCYTNTLNTTTCVRNHTQL